MGGTKDVNIEKIRKLAPTHVVVNIDENEKPTVDSAGRIRAARGGHPSELAPRDNLALARLMGGIFGARRGGGALVRRLRGSELRSAGAQAPGRPRTVLYCIWQDPWMAVSRRHLYRPHAGGTRLAACRYLGDSARYPAFSWSQELVDGLDAVLLSTEPYRFTEAHADALEKQLGKPVLLVDGEMMSWYGTRALKGLNYLQELGDR